MTSGALEWGWEGRVASTFRQKLESVYYIFLLVVGGGVWGWGSRGMGLPKVRSLLYTPHS